jgi:2-polyprenyl-3-methyl-5-hydroxy-6-metoxy-1,4-benzoquinol methylase
MDKDKVRKFTDRIFTDMAGTMTAGMAFVGVKTGLFRAMAGKGPMGLDDVVRASGLQPRYVEEWLNGMTAAGYLTYDPAAKTFELPEEHAFMLASDGTDHFAGGLFAMAPVLLNVAPRVADAFAAGGGVPFAAFGPEGVAALDMLNRGQYEHRFQSYWLKAVPDVMAKLSTGGRALDFGCGMGRVSIAIAQGFPTATVVGVDADSTTLAQAKAAADAAGVGDRVRFAQQLPREPASFDLIAACDCIHDLERPKETLAALRALLKPDGTLFIAEPKAADRLEDNLNPVATMFYGFSLFHCMTQSLARGGPGLGTCMGPAKLEELLREAGYSAVRRLDIKSQVNLFYAATV